MKKLINELLQKNIDDDVISIKEITGLVGSVNKVYDIKGKNSYVVITHINDRIM